MLVCQILSAERRVQVSFQMETNGMKASSLSNHFVQIYCFDSSYLVQFKTVFLELLDDADCTNTTSSILYGNTFHRTFSMLFGTSASNTLKLDFLTYVFIFTNIAPELRATFSINSSRRTTAFNYQIIVNIWSSNKRQFILIQLCISCWVPHEIPRFLLWYQMLVHLPDAVYPIPVDYTAAFSRTIHSKLHSPWLNC